MKKHTFRKALFVNFIILTLIMLCCCTKSSDGGAAQIKATGEFSVTALNIGKADSLILKTQNHTVLIDCGEKGDVSDIISALSESGITEIDRLIITHFDKDHVGSAAKLIKKISVNQIITPNYRSDSEEYKDFIAAAEENNLTPITLTENLSFVYDDVTFEVYPPEKSFYAEGDNDYSLAVRAVHGQNSFLFTGDAEETRLAEFKNQFSLTHTFLKVPHHGRCNSYTDRFIKSVAPEYAVITCSAKNPPDDDTLSALESVGCQTFLTQNGTAKFISNGENIYATQ